MYNAIQQQLKNAGLKITHPRVIILTTLIRQEQEMTVKQVYQQLYLNQQKISLATVYRVIADLEAVGLIMQNQFSRGEAKYSRLNLAQESCIQIQYTDFNGHDQTQFLESLQTVFKKFNVNLLKIKPIENLQTEKSIARTR